MDERPTAIFVCNDAMAYGVLAVAEELGWHVPTRLAVVGFDDNAFSALVRPPLTTVHQPFEEMGQCAAEMLLTLINQRYPFAQEESIASPSYSQLLAKQEEGQASLQVHSTAISTLHRLVAIVPGCSYIFIMVYLRLQD